MLSTKATSSTPRPTSTDILVVGGGATGLGIALDAALRGLSVIVLEKQDLGQGTSGRYHGLLHSGGRYVVSDPASATDCACENRALRRIASSCIEDTGGMFIATASDSLDFTDTWLGAARRSGVEAEEISPAAALALEPCLASDIQRVFTVPDASLDSFDLLHLLANAITRAGGEVWVRHSLEGVETHQGRVVRVRARAAGSHTPVMVEARIVVNAAGPWAGEVAARAGASLPLALGKGTMLALAGRPIHTILNRCKPPADGDIIVPVGTVTVLGTTDEPRTDPEDLSIEPWEIDLLIREACLLVPEIAGRRALRAWAGMRPLYRPPAPDDAATRTLPRAHTIIDHQQTTGPDGLVSIIGGKLTTYRLMAQEVVDLVAPRLGNENSCITSSTSLEAATKRYHRLPARLATLERATPPSFSAGILCECELVLNGSVEQAIEQGGAVSLDDIRRDTRLGMGPCQAGFCAYRAAALLAARRPNVEPDGGLQAFLDERWRGIRPLAWGANLRQAALDLRITQELLGLHGSTAVVDD